MSHRRRPTLIGTLGNPVKIRSWPVPTLGAGALGWVYSVLWAGPGGPRLPPTLSLSLLRDAFPEAAWGRSEAGGQERRKLSGTGAG